MNINEARKILEISESSTDDELKAKYKSMAKKYHPDVYKKDPDKFKKINEAYQFVQNYKNNPQPTWANANNDSFKYSDINIEDIFSNFGGFGGGTFRRSVVNEQQPKHNNFPSIELKSELSFKESILGCDKEIIYKRFIKCAACNGNGIEYINNGCTSCNGFGRVTVNNNNMIYTSVCKKCYGKDIKNNKCRSCKSNGYTETEVSGTVHIPPGTPNDAKLRLQGMGHFKGATMLGDMYTDAFVHVSVKPEPNMTLSGTDVLSTINISLFEALTGCTKNVSTVISEKEIKIKPKAKNKDEIRIPGHGVKNTNGAHRFIINIDYPDDIAPLLSLLQPKE